MLVHQYRFKDIERFSLTFEGTVNGGMFIYFSGLLMREGFSKTGYLSGIPNTTKKIISVTNDKHRFTISGEPLYTEEEILADFVESLVQKIKKTEIFDVSYYPIGDPGTTSYSFVNRYFTGIDPSIGLTLEDVNQVLGGFFHEG